jgi:hypothetical protein
VPGVQALSCAVAQRHSSCAPVAPARQAAENYDWRLSIADLERRDHYFTVLRNRVELLHQMNGEKARLARLVRFLSGPTCV